MAMAGGNPNFKPGRKKGSKTKMPTAAKQAVRDCFERVGEDKPELLMSVLMDGLLAGPPTSLGYLRLWAEYSLQKPEQRFKVDGTVRKVIKVILPSPDELSDGPSLDASYTVAPDAPGLSQASVANFLEASKD